MSWMIADYVGSAYQSLHRSRMRTLLTTLGIAIGVASVTAILALSGGLTDVITKQLDKLGGNLIVVRPGSVAPTANTLVVPANQQNYITSTLSEKDVEVIQGVEGVQAAAPLMVLSATLKTETRILENNVVVATTPGFQQISKLEVRDGEFITEGSSDHVAILGHQLAVDLFGTEKPIGLTFTIRGERFTVVGILKPSMDPVNYNRIDFDSAVFINFGVAKALNQGRTQIQQVDIRANEVSTLAPTGQKINAALLVNHHGEQDFSVIVGKQVSGATNDLMRAAAGVMTAIAAISLVVGGVGIMNIMLVSVAERTREIGIRKAVGATSGSIAGQFMIESVMMSLLGGFLGYLLGYTVAFGISTFVYFVPSVNWQVAAIALTMSLGVGVVFGFYPALRAARKQPIESLRQYH
jgi:ABC-type antimicrobial peptide transport system permease subunit